MEENVKNQKHMYLCIYICITESLRCTSQTNNIVNQLFHFKKNLRKSRNHVLVYNLDLICLMTNHVEHLFLCLFAIHFFGEMSFTYLSTLILVFFFLLLCFEHSFFLESICQINNLAKIFWQWFAITFYLTIYCESKNIWNFDKAHATNLFLGLFLSIILKSLPAQFQGFNFKSFYSSRFYF